MIIAAVLKYKCYMGAGFTHELATSFLDFWLQKNGVGKRENGTCGFMDENGDYLTREAAAVHAFDCGQIVEFKDRLMSADIKFTWEQIEMAQDFAIEHNTKLLKNEVKTNTGICLTDK